jgi:hypothetical protein
MSAPSSSPTASSARSLGLEQPHRPAPTSRVVGASSPRLAFKNRARPLHRLPLLPFLLQSRSRCCNHITAARRDPPSASRRPRATSAPLISLGELAFIPASSLCLHILQSWSVWTFSRALARSPPSAMAATVSVTFPACVKRMVGLAISPASSRCSHISKPWAVGRFPRTPASFRSPAMAAPLWLPLFRPARRPILSPHLIAVVQIKSNGRSRTVPLHSAVFVKSPSVSCLSNPPSLAYSRSTHSHFQNVVSSV